MSSTKAPVATVNRHMIACMTKISGMNDHFQCGLGVSTSEAFRSGWNAPVVEGLSITRDLVT